MIDTAIILAGGLGTRLRPLTLTTPKPLIPVHDKPLIEHLIENLKQHNVTNIILTIGYLADQIKDYFGDGSRFGVNISYCIENEPLGTGGAIKLAANGLSEPFIALNGDNLSDFDYTKMIESYHTNNTPVQLTLFPVEDVTKFGIADLKDNIIVNFIEKPTREEAPTNLNNAGGYIIHPKMLDILPEGRSSIEKDLWEKIAPQGMISAFIHENQWFPTDTLEKYEHAKEHFNPISDSFSKNVQNQNKDMQKSPIFKSYDIRGEWDVDFNIDTVEKIAHALVNHFSPKVIVIGRDMRPSSIDIFNTMAESFTNKGITVKDVGLCSTELTYYASSFFRDIDLALMITASHNPAKDNGIKITSKGGISIGLENGLSQIRDEVHASTIDNSLQSNSQEEKGIIEQFDIWAFYKHFVFSELKNLPLDFSRLTIAVDPGNGVGGIMFDKILGNINSNIIRMNWEPDGTFPNHPADPSREKNTRQLQQKVQETGANIGIAYDGDGDRVFFVDEKGEYIEGYYLVALLVDYMLSSSSNPTNETIVYDTRYFWAIQDVVKKYGAKSVQSKVGHVNLKKLMREHNALFSMEGSGHSFYKSTNFTESSMLTTLIVLHLISTKGPLSEQIEKYKQKYPVSGEINFIVEDPLPILSQVKEKYSFGKVKEFDGLNVELDTWRFTLRSSNTQSLLRLSLEAETKELVDQKVLELRSMIHGTEVDY